MVEPAKDEGRDMPGSRGATSGPPLAPVADGLSTRAPSGPRAGFWVRFDALLIDLVLLSAVAGAFIGFGPDSPSSWLRDAVDPRALLLLLGYFTFFEGTSSGQTVGKKLLNIRVVDFNTGESIGFARAAVRNVVAYFLSVILLLGYLWMLWDEEKQTWHDKIASSIVVPTDAYPVDKWPG